MSYEAGPIHKFSSGNLLLRRLSRKHKTVFLPEKVDFSPCLGSFFYFRVTYSRVRNVKQDTSNFSSPRSRLICNALPAICFPHFPPLPTPKNEAWLHEGPFHVHELVRQLCLETRSMRGEHEYSKEPLSVTSTEKDEGRHSISFTRSSGQ